MKKVIIITLLLSFVSLFCFAQTEDKSAAEDYVKLYEEALKENMALQAHRDTLNKCIDSSKKEEAELRKMLNSIEKDSVKTENAIKNIKKSKEYVKYDKLLSTIDSLKRENEKQDSILKSLELILMEKGNELAELEGRKSELEKSKNEFCQNLISRNKYILEKPFSEMSLDELNSVRSKCQPYTVDQSIKDFVEKIDKMIKSKKQYDSIVQVLKTKYNAANVLNAQNSIKNIYCGNETQKSELAKVSKQLSIFKQGLEALKEFVAAVNRDRQGRSHYTFSDFMDVKDIILEEKGLGKRIDDYVMNVPYLKTSYEDFMKDFEANPTGHSNIENEILNQ